MSYLLCPTGHHHALRYTHIGKHIRVIECAGCGQWGLQQRDRDGQWTVENTWSVPPERHARNLGLVLP